MQVLGGPAHTAIVQAPCSTLQEPEAHKHVLRMNMDSANNLHALEKDVPVPSKRPNSSFALPARDLAASASIVSAGSMLMARMGPSG